MDKDTTEKMRFLRKTIKTPSVWTKKDYLEWLKDRPDDPADWSRDDCLAADRHIKTVTLYALSRALDQKSFPKELKDWIMFLAENTIGAGETDEMLISLGCYPDYMDTKEYI